MKSKILFSSWLFCFAFLANAQTNLSAKQAVFIALENNFNVQVAEKQVLIAQKNNTWSEAGLFPTVALNVALNNSIQDNTNNPFTFTPGVILMQGISPSLSANWNIFSGMAVRISKQRLEQLEAQSNGNATVVIENTIQDVLKAYYAVQLQMERVKLFDQLKKYSKSRVDYLELKDKYAKSSSLELLQYRNQYFSDSTSHLLQQVSYENAMRNLLLIMNEDKVVNEREFPVLTDPLEFVLPLLDTKQAVQEMKANNQNLKNQYISVELQKKATEYQRSFLYPTLSFQTGVTPSHNWLRDLNNDNLKIETQVINYYGNLNLRYSIFNNWKAKRAVEVSKIQEDIAEMTTDNMVKSLEISLQNLLDMYAMRTKLVSLSETNLSYATKAFELAKSRYELGTLSSIELAVFQNNFQNTLLQHNENLFNRLDTYLEIYKMTGKIGLEAQRN
jgi:outer membrane protein TolC